MICLHNKFSVGDHPGPASRCLVSLGSREVPVKVARSQKVDREGPHGAARAS